MKVAISKLKELTSALLLRNGICEEHADIIFNHLLDEELLGKHSHGFVRIPAIINAIKTFEGDSSISYSQPTEFAMRIITDNMVGLVAAYKAAHHAVSIADEKGFAIVSAIGYKGTTGALGYYGRILAVEGYIGIISCSSEYAVAPWGGKDAILGTNPIAIAIPNNDKPIICDFATAAMTYGDLMLAVKEGRKVPYGIVLDSNGHPSNNPDDANNGCQLPMAGHKGYALSMAVEVLAGLFIGAKSGKDAVRGSDGIIILAIKPDLFVSQDQYLINLASLINEIKNSSPAINSTGIRLPGENSVNQVIMGRKSGTCDLPSVVYQEMLDLIGDN